jgi:Tfp pilus assembly protein PilF
MAGQARAAALLAAAATLLLLAGNLLLHPIPLYGTETDLVGEYIPAAHELSQGVLRPEHFTTKGPVYPLLLALVAPLVRNDWFLAARALNSIAAGLVIWATYSFFASLGGRVALAVCLGLIVTPVFLLAGFEAGTDLPALALALGSSCVVFASSSKPRFFFGGLLAGFAALTRSNLISVAIAGLLILAVHAEWRTALGFYVAGVLLPVLAWLGVHVATTGGLPHDSNYLSLAHAVYGTHQGWEDFLTTSASRFGTYADVLRPDPLRVLSTVVTNLATRWWSDATRLLPLPIGILGVVGIAWCWRRYRSSFVLAAHATSAYVILCFAFYAPRFSLYLLPFYLSGVALLLLPRSHQAMQEQAAPSRQWKSMAGGGALALLYVVSAVISLGQLRAALSKAPEVTRQVGLALRLMGPSEAAVMARKPHVAYYAGMRYVPMPRTGSLTDLIVEANRAGAQFVFVSQTETSLRPEYTVLTDSGQSLPGLRQVVYRRSRLGPAAAYSVSPPLPNEISQRRAVATSLERGGVLGRERRIAIATELLSAGDYGQALRQLLAADSSGPPNADIAALESNAFHALHMYEEAAQACSRSIELGGGTAAHYDQLGRIRFQQGRYDEAAQNFRNALEQAPGVTGPRYLLGLSEYRRGRYDAAARAFQAYLVNQPGSMEARRLAAVSLARSGRLGDALHTIQEGRDWSGSDRAGAASFSDSLRRGELPE